jgi:2-polyprenyl-3-methyl-5-hydroxy-6-metoxy-1,4-benzoquinol methylase
MTQCDRESEILSSWFQNAKPWTDIIRQRGVASRERVTNQAIVDAVLEGDPAYVLDVGTGEGWLVRELAKRGIRGVGIDAVPALIESARIAGQGRFEVVQYGDLLDGRLEHERFDAVVCNFSLIGKESTEAVIRSAQSLLTAEGRLIIQTLHPVEACGALPYQDGWRPGEWTGFGEAFKEPAPWYVRTFESWRLLIKRFGFEIVKELEPEDFTVSKPMSVIFVAVARRARAD